MAKRKKAVAISVSADPYNSLLMIVYPKNPEQQEMLDTIKNNIITFVKGAPGSGKTFIAISHALDEVFKGNYSSIVFTRPVIEAAGEKLGFLPGNMHEKIDPYMMPIWETLAQLITSEKLQKLISKNGKPSIIRILPLAYMRGNTFKNSIIICDEMQNSTPAQIRMLLTRIGEGSKIVICGDVLQSDIYKTSGLEDAFKLLKEIDGIGFVTLTQDAIVRHPIIAKIEERYEARRKELLQKAV